MRTHHRLFAIVALVLAATLPGIREGAAAQPACPCWVGGVSGLSNLLLNDVDLEMLKGFDICSTHPTVSEGVGAAEPGGIGTGVCASEDMPGDGFASCSSGVQFLEPQAFAIFDRVVGLGRCNVKNMDEAMFANPAAPSAWACINDIATLCRSLR